MGTLEHTLIALALSVACLVVLRSPWARLRGAETVRGGNTATQPPVETQPVSTRAKPLPPAPPGTIPGAYPVNPVWWQDDEDRRADEWLGEYLDAPSRDSQMILWEAIGPDAVRRADIDKYNREIAEALLARDEVALGRTIMVQAISYLGREEQ